MSERVLKPASILVLGLFFISIGSLHFLQPEPFARIVPQGLPAPLALVWISGLAEILGGAGMLLPGWRRRAGLGLIVLLIAVFPANINMAVNHIYTGWMNSDFLLWARLPLQLVLIAWIEWTTRFSPPV
jgi:uncharacterized membrane protein